METHVRLLTALIVVIVSGTPISHCWPSEGATSRFSAEMPKIVGGDPIDIKEAPYQLSFQTRYKGHICGASIIGNKYALSAAQCTEALSSDNTAKVRAGSTQYASGGTLYNVDRVFVHDKYDKQLLDYDIVVLLIEGEFVPSETVRNITLPVPNYDLSQGSRMIVNGWGRTADFGPLTKDLRRVELALIERSECIEKMGGRDVITPRMICTYTPGKDSCQGDGGGALYSLWAELQFGIVSWGYFCGRQYPGVYTRVSDPEIRDFITRITGI